MAQCYGNLHSVELGLWLNEIAFFRELRKQFTTSYEVQDEEDFVIGLENVVEADKEGVVQLFEDFLLQVRRLNFIVLKDDVFP